MRNGAATKDGREVVLGTIFMLVNENSRNVSVAVADKLEEVNRSMPAGVTVHRSEEHTSELQSLMRISYAVFCLKKKHVEITTDQKSIVLQHRTSCSHRQ